MDAMNVLEEALRVTSVDRPADYGHPIDDFRRTALMWSGILQPYLRDGIILPPEVVGLCMICVKLSRECNKHKLDNLVDIAGYARTIQRVYEVQS